METKQAVDEILQAESVLYAVTTVKEASRKWGKSETAIKLACEASRLDARHSGGTWIITLESLERIYGLPIDGTYDW